MRIKAGVLSCMLLAVCSTGYALDTTEAFDPGFSDVEVYFGYAGLDNPSGASTVSSEMLMGIGVTESFSTSVCFSAEANGYLADPEDGITVGLLWTAINSDAFKLDFSGTTGTDGSIALGVESNFDFNNWGFQAQIEETIENKGSNERNMSTRLQPLLYYRFSSGVELLSAVDFEYAENEDGENEFNYSSISFGVNFPMNESIEAISQIDLVNGDNDENEIGISFGFVA
ncbi:MAG: hypothetical protein KAS73_11350, partial [Candidatus Sabulitectum sp.]|nr:hypothetical protein [Candidatus Sabulitectum sp.]